MNLLHQPKADVAGIFGVQSLPEHTEIQCENISWKYTCLVLSNPSNSEN